MEEEIKKIIMNNATVYICKDCSGGGADGQSKCSNCKGTGLIDWDLDYTVQKIMEYLNQTEQEVLDTTTRMSRI